MESSSSKLSRKSKSNDLNSVTLARIWIHTLSYFLRLYVLNSTNASEVFDKDSFISSLLKSLLKIFSSSISMNTFHFDCSNNKKRSQKRTNNWLKFMTEIRRLKIWKEKNINRSITFRQLIFNNRKKERKILNVGGMEGKNATATCSQNRTVERNTIRLAVNLTLTAELRYVCDYFFIVYFPFILNRFNSSITSYVLICKISQMVIWLLSISILPLHSVRKFWWSVIFRGQRFQLRRNLYTTTLNLIIIIQKYPFYTSAAVVYK